MFRIVCSPQPTSSFKIQGLFTISRARYTYCDVFEAYFENGIIMGNIGNGQSQKNILNLLSRTTSYLLKHPIRFVEVDAWKCSQRLMCNNLGIICGRFTPRA